MKHFRTISISIFAFVAIAMQSRTLDVVSFGSSERDIDARVNSVRDRNGNLCALIKVAIPRAECKFEGSVISQNYDINEYKVYMSPGAKTLQLRYSGYETLRVDLTEYTGSDGLVGGTTYELKLSGYDNTDNSVVSSTDVAGGNFLVIDVLPKAGAVVKVNNEILPVEDGKASTFLQYGSYVVSVEAAGYIPETRTVNINREASTNLTLQLQSVMATLSVNTSTSGASIIINGKQKSTTGKFSGELAPGTYLVEIEKAGFKKYTQTVTLAKSEHKEINAGSLEAILGALKIDFKPIGAKILIDGKDAGTSPAVINDLAVGRHSVKITNDGYKDYSANIEVSKDRLVSLYGILNPLPVDPNADPNNPHKYAPGKIKVEGYVYNGRGKSDPLIGATVMIVNSNWGVATDIDGYFQAYVYPGETLEFKYIKKKSKKVKITDQKLLEIHM